MTNDVLSRVSPVHVTRRVAVIGSGISGLAAAHALAAQAHVTLFEAGDYFGGHTHTVDVTLEGVTHGVDTGFLVCNQRTYPHLMRLFAEMDVPLTGADMSFSVQWRARGVEWCGSDLNTVFAQRRNLLRPWFWRLLADILRFNRIATEMARRDPEVSGTSLTAHAGLPARTQSLQTIAQFLDRERFSAEFRDGYLLPMVASIWSCPPRQMLEFPLETLVRFCHNHGLLQVRNRPQWFSVAGGARTYVERLLERVGDARLNNRVTRVRRLGADDSHTGVMVTTPRGSERFDEVVVAVHSDQALGLLAEASAGEADVLGAIRYQPNRAVLHTDTTLMPTRRNAWAAWNHENAGAAGDTHGVCLHYWLNRLQRLPFSTPVIVSLNPVRAPRPETVLGEFDYAHPVFDAGAIAAQRRLPELQGRGGVWYCGAWTRYGFHEDGLVSALSVCEQMRARWAAAAVREAA
jgi:uncharacterized protein